MKMCNTFACQVVFSAAKWKYDKKQKQQILILTWMKNVQ